MHGHTRKYELIDHTADVGIHVFGSDPKDLFANAAYALFDLITDLKQLNGKDRQDISVRGEDLPDLMVNWLREMLFLWNGRGLLVKKTDVTALAGKELSAAVFHEPYDPQRHLINLEIKAVTYHQVRVEPGPDGWEAKIIFDV